MYATFTSTIDKGLFSTLGNHIAIIVSIRLGKAKIDCLLTISIAYKLRTFFESHQQKFCFLCG